MHKKDLDNINNDRFIPKEWNSNWEINGKKSSTPCCDNPKFPPCLIFTHCDNCGSYVSFKNS